MFCLLAAMCLCQLSLQACTGIKLRAKDGAIVHGRTLEFGVKVDTSIAVFPRGYAFQSTTPTGPGYSYNSKFAAVGAIAFGNMAILDGMNEMGLAVGTFYFPGYADYAVISPENQSKALSPIDFPNWIVCSFASVDEVKKALDSVVIAPTVIPQWGKTAPPPFHYIVYDKSGACLVIEPIGGKLVTYDNPIGTFTNSPTFDWHMTNLRNYINLTPFNVNPYKVDGLELAPFGQGAGLVGLPGDFTPPSRFVRAAIFSMTAVPSANADAAVFQAFHVLNQFDIPVGSAREKEKGVTAFDYTLITSVKNPQSLRYYFRTFDDQTIRFVDLRTFDLDAKVIKQASTSQYSQPAVEFVIYSTLPDRRGE